MKRGGEDMSRFFVNPYSEALAAQIDTENYCQCHCDCDVANCECNW